MALLHLCYNSVTTNSTKGLSQKMEENVTVKVKSLKISLEVVEIPKNAQNWQNWPRKESYHYTCRIMRKLEFVDSQMCNRNVTIFLP